MSFKVHVKWGKEQYKDIELNTTDSPQVFKAQLFALTNVQPDRQKNHAQRPSAWQRFMVKLCTKSQRQHESDDDGYSGHINSPGTEN